jgi:hypothetical protein
MSTESSLSNRLLRFSAGLLLAGILISFLAGYFHPDHAPANNHVAAFTEYAGDANWTAVHLGQFAGMAIIILGQVVLFFALDIPSGTAAWANRFGLIFAVVALALYAVLQAVDGVALKHAVDAWINAPQAEKAARFASAEVVRWLEWAVRSYQSYVLGLAFLCFGSAIVLTGRVSKVIGSLMGFSGLAYLAQGWVLGSQGFSSANTVPTLLGIAVTLTWSIGLCIVSWRAKGTEIVAAKRELAG